MGISIIIPVYNTEKYLRKCLDSIINQTFIELEIILINDGSTDLSGVICEEYSRIDERIIVLHQENGGVSSARNRGLSIANGKYIGFVDPDDWVEPDMYERLHQLMTEHQTDIAACGAALESSEGKRLNPVSDLNLTKYNHIEALDTILDTEGFQGYVCNKLFSSDIIKSKPAILFDTEIHYGEDLLFCCEIIQKCKAIIYDPKPRYHYIIHDSNTTLSKYSEKKLTLLNALDKIISQLSRVDGINTNIFKRFYIQTNINLLMHGIKQQKCTKFRQHHLKRNVIKYKLTAATKTSIKIPLLLIKINIKLCYLVWNFYTTSIRYYKKWNQTREFLGG